MDVQHHGRAVVAAEGDVRAPRELGGAGDPSVGVRDGGDAGIRRPHQGQVVVAEIHVVAAHEDRRRAEAAARHRVRGCTGGQRHEQAAAGQGQRPAHDLVGRAPAAHGDDDIALALQVHVHRLVNPLMKNLGRCLSVAAGTPRH